MSSPSTGSSVWTGLTLDWLSHTGVSYYDMQLDTLPTFDSPVVQTYSKAYTNSSSGNSDTEHYVQHLFFGITYYWRVRARNAVDSSTWSTPWTINTRDYVTLVSPNNGQLNVNVAGVGLDWNAHVGISYYQLQIDTTNLFNSISLTNLDKPYVNSSNSNSDTYQHTGPLLSNQIYFWRVRAVNAIDSSAWTLRSFSTGNNPVLIPSIPLLVAPFDGVTNVISSATLEWGASSNATSYQFMYDTLPDFSTAVSGITTTTSELISGLNNNNKIYYWKVRAMNGTSIYSDWSVVWTFLTGTTVNVYSGEMMFSVYPNPFGEYIVIDLSGEAGADIFIHNVGGLLVHYEAIPQGKNVNGLMNLPSGFYNLKISGNHGTTFVKLIKH
jgi:hypothetical protein